MIKSITILALLILGLSLLLPWWIIVVISFLFILLTKQYTLLKSILVTFASGVIAYTAYCIFTTIGVEHNPAILIGDLFGELPAFSSYIVTGLIGGLTAAFGGMTGYLGRKILIQKN